MSGSHVLRAIEIGAPISLPPLPQQSIDPALTALLDDVIQHSWLNPVFQPIIDMRTGALIGYEGLIRGPQGSALHSPVHLFGMARMCGRGLRLESLCSEVILKKFVELALPGRIFLNISPDSLSKAGLAYRAMLAKLEKIGLAPQRIILELTENQATYDYEQMREVLRQCRDLGFQIAIDDLGEGCFDVMKMS